MSDSLSRSDKILIDKTYCLFLIRGHTTDNQPQYAYVAVKAKHVEALRKALASGDTDITKYSSVIAHGLGEPSEEVRQRMEEEYGFNHEKMLEIPSGD